MANSSIPTPEEALAGMAKVGSPREPMGKSGVAFTAPSASPKAGTLVKKTGNAKGGTDPYAQPKPSRTNVQIGPNGGEANGAAYRIRASYMKQTSPEAGATQANGRRFKPATSRPGFDDGVAASY
jgi:hypothetical protein